jgi:hypothetical protein
MIWLEEFVPGQRYVGAYALGWDSSGCALA